MAVPRATPLRRFEAPLRAIDDVALVLLPESVSAELPSRGQVAVRGELDGIGFETVLEPDGTFGHWLRVDDALRAAAGVDVGDAVAVEFELRADWPEPAVPADLAAALAAAPSDIVQLWDEITPMARWEWVRWVNATRNPDTRTRRVEVSISKLGNGKRRPCCFNLSSCTDPDLSRSGKLREPSPASPRSG
jgi:hypothetical protein